MKVDHEKLIPALQKKIAIGSISTRNAIFLAPMSGVSDAPFRRAAWACGAGMVTSEMVASEALLSGHIEMQMKAENAGLPVHMVQIAGREAHWMAKAAEMAEAGGADIIDINMGCPARKVTNGYSGSALMRDLDHALTLIEAVVKAVKVPVTLKMRLGWDHDKINAPELASRAVDAGIQLITVHGRTRCQFYKGSADWDAVKAVRQVIKVPLVVNGDILSEETAHSALAASGADGVMIGRGSYGQPQICGIIASSKAPNNAAATINYDVVSHYEDMLDFYGNDLGLRCARKHIGWWMDRQTVSIDNSFKQTIMTSKRSAEVIAMLLELRRENVSGDMQRQPTNKLAAA